MDKVIKNATQEPAVYYARHMYAGLAGYKDEKVLVDLDAMLRLSKTFPAKPVYVEHQDVDLESINQAAGLVSDCWYNEKDGWLWVKMVIMSDEGHQAIKNGWSVSNAYIPTEMGSGGTQTNIPYQSKIIDGKFTHLAIVPNPRYESAKIYSVSEYEDYLKALNLKKELTNSKTTKAKKMAFKFFKNEKKEVSSLEDISGVMVDLDNGKSIALEQIVNAVIEKDELEAENKKNSVDMDAKINVGDKEMAIKDLINKYQNMCKETELESEKDDDEVEETKEKSNSCDDMMPASELPKSKEEGKEFKELKNAEYLAAPKKVMLQMDGIALGKERY